MYIMNKFTHNATLPSSGKNNLYPNLDMYRTGRTFFTKCATSINSKLSKKNNYINSNQKAFLAKKKEFRNKYELNPTVYIKPLGLKNEGLFCWLNSSIKLLLSMLDIEDISLISTISSRDPHKTINKIRSSFIYLWSIYHDFTGEVKIREETIITRESMEQRLNSAKIILINRFKQFVKEGGIESDGLQDYFLSENPNQRQDCNLFLIAMRTILCLDNPAHNLKCCTYIDGIHHHEQSNKKIIRKSSENPALFIKLPPDQNISSINDYIEFLGIKEKNTYYWSEKELLEQGINVTSDKDIPIKGNKFEKVEADLANLDNFIVYFSLLSTDRFSLMDAHNKIINIVLSKKFPDDYINIYDTNNICKQYALPVKIKAIICFSGYGEKTHYICITIENNNAIVHNDNRVCFLGYNNSSEAQTNYSLKQQIRSFFNQHHFTPYSILYTSSV